MSADGDAPSDRADDESGVSSPDSSADAAASDDAEPRDGGLDPRIKASVLWGIIGGLSFLVLIQGYELLTPERVTVGAKAATTAVVVVSAAVATYVTRDRVANGNESA